MTASERKKFFQAAIDNKLSSGDQKKLNREKAMRRKKKELNNKMAMK
jgi:hypothetical protein